jgi:hypothetical protein
MNPVVPYQPDARAISFFALFVPATTLGAQWHAGAHVAPSAPLVKRFPAQNRNRLVSGDGARGDFCSLTISVCGKGAIRDIDSLAFFVLLVSQI